MGICSKITFSLFFWSVLIACLNTNIPNNFIHLQTKQLSWWIISLSFQYKIAAKIEEPNNQAFAKVQRVKPMRLFFNEWKIVHYFGKLLKKKAKY